MQQPVRLSFRLSDLRTAVCDSPKLVVYRTRFLGHKFVSCGGPE